ncbi:MAG: cysteine desulfurase [Sandaracinaceae bacterium]|nr:cysteine desulfurase [Sandaracinaceae bacterium]
MNVETTKAAARGLDAAAIRRDFPALAQVVHGRPLVYLDSAATALKPEAVIDAVTKVYAEDCANIHRAVHLLSQRATQSYEAVRGKVRAFLGASSEREVVFVRGTTEAINLVANAWARPRLGRGDRVLVSGLEHHSNIVPWQMVCAATGAELVVVPITDAGEVLLSEVEARLDARVKLVAMSHASNALGSVVPVEAIVERAHAVGAKVLLDGAQAAPHLTVDVTAIGCDFYAFSGHKLYGPTGAGVLWGRLSLLEEMDPWQGGGDMIRSVTFEKTTYADVPAKLEAGTPDIAAVIGLGAAIDYVSSLGREAIAQNEAELLAYGTEALSSVPGVRVIGTAAHKIGVLSFVMEGAHPHDIGTIVDAEGVAIRTGHHCAQPVMERLGIPATARASLGLYNTREDLDALVRALHRVRELFS